MTNDAMTNDDDNLKSDRDDLSDDVTIAASSDGVERLRDAIDRIAEDADVSVWTGGAATERAAASGADSADPGLASEPTVIKGFGSETDITTPLQPSDSASKAAANAEAKAAKAAAKAKSKAPKPARPKPAPKAAPVTSKPVVAGGSLIEGMAPPEASTEFFTVSDLAAQQNPTNRLARRRGRYPLWLLFGAVALVAVTVTVVVLLVLGTSGTTA